MSAEPRSVNTIRVAEAIYFNSGMHRLFGWLHGSIAGPTTDVGVVLCQPFGYESICAHRGMRSFAEAISAAGMPALRFDYSGTGDSSDVDDKADQLQIWTQDVLAAAQELRVRTGVRQVCLLGFRLGALLATLAASQKDSNVSAIVAVAPIVVGRKYLRELRTMRLAAAMALGESEPGSEKDAHQGMEVSGFNLSMRTIEALRQVDVSALELPRMLAIAAAKMPTGDGESASPNDSERTTHVALPGLIEMLMTPPQFAVVPNQVIALTIDWLLKLPVQVPPVPDSNSTLQITDSSYPGPEQELTLKGDGSVPDGSQTEKPVFFGVNALLFGIVTQPHVSETRRRAVILLNAGADHHIGPSRLYVSLARRWARSGYVVLRMDLAGVGDSGIRPGRVQDDVFPQEALDDIRAGIELLRSNYQIRDVTLAGLCSGAYHALRAAVAELPVNCILMVNPQNYFWRPGETLQGLQLAEVAHNPGLYRARLFSKSAWRRMITGRVNLLRIARIYLQRPILDAESKLRNIARRLHLKLRNDLGSELEQVAARGVRVVFVFARGEPGISLLKLQAGNAVQRLAERCHVHIINSGDHVFTRSGPRAMMEKAVTDELFARPEWLDSQSKTQRTGGLKIQSKSNVD